MYTQKTLTLLVHLLIKAFVIFLIILMFLPTPSNGYFLLCFYALIITVGGSFAFLFLSFNTILSDFSFLLLVLSLFSLVPLYLLALWYHSSKKSNLLMHIATFLWVINGGVAAFGYLIASI